jgi:aminopeptidase N
MLRNRTTQVIRLSEYKTPDYLVDKVHVSVSLHPTQTKVVVTSRVKPNPARIAGAVPLMFDGDELALHAIALDGAPLPSAAYEATPDKLVLKAPPQRPFDLTIETVIDPSANSKLMGLYRSSGVYTTQCEADGFRRISYFPDRPDVMATYRVRLEADKADAPVLLANGNLVEQADIAGTGRHYAVWDDPHPKPCYLFAMVGGDLGAIHDRFTTSEGRNVALGIYVEKGKEDQAHYAMDSLKRSMRWDEEAFGRAYDLDAFNIVAVSDFNMGAMENKGLNIFNDKYVLASSETATDTDYALIEAIIAHEYFHNWTGNRITCRDWFQLCLKEGLTVFRDQEFSSDMRSRAVKRIMDVRELRSRQFVEDAGPLAHPVRPTAYREINNFYTATVYEKGAEVIRMLKLLIGDEAFRTGMDLYFARHDGDAATIEQFIACFAESSGKDLGHFSQWYDQAGTPRVMISRAYNEATRELALTLSQQTSPTPGQPDKQPQVIPVALGFVSSADETLAADQTVIVLDKAELTVRFPDMAKSAVPSLFRGFSAPVNVDLDLTDSELLTLARRDSDPFNRWQSLQTLAMRTLKRSAEAVREGRPALIHDELAEAVGECLIHGHTDPAFTALAVTMPSEQDIAREIGENVDPDAIHLARMTLRRTIGAHAAEVAARIHTEFRITNAYSPGSADAGRRALRNAALDLLVVGEAPGAMERAFEQFSTADNMTDRFAALAILAHAGGPLKEEALARFEQQYQHNPLVMDKWFALQAVTADADVLDRVRALMRHPAFSLTNPNRARSLIGGFAMSNATQFNRADGLGYQFAAEMILQIDAKNPQVAARIMTAFRSWRNMDMDRRAKAQDVLLQIANQNNLSRDLRDIVERTLT